jgi:hypothetical protein
VASLLLVGNRAKMKKIKTASYTADVRSAIQYVRRCIDAGFSAVEAYPHRVLTIRYEALVSDPKRECLKICDYLRIPWSDQMLSPERIQHPGQEAITNNSGEIWYDSNSYNRPLHSESLEKWRADLSPASQVAVTDFFRGDPNLTRLEYDFSPPELPWKTRMTCRILNTLVRMKIAVLSGMRALARGL